MNFTTNITVATVPSQVCFGTKNLPYKRTDAILVTAIITSIINFIACVFATTANGLSLIVLLKTTSLRTPSNLLLASMSLTDFLVGLLVQSLYVVLRIYEMIDQHLCTLKLVYSFIGYLCSGASMLNLCFISIDRWFAITMPYRYNPEVIYNKYIVAVAAIWILWLLYTLLPFSQAITYNAYFKSLPWVMFISLSVSAVCYFKIYRIVRRHVIRVAAMVPQEVSSSKASVSVAENGIRKRNRAWWKSQRARSFTSGIIVVVFLACYVPKLCQIVVTNIIGDSIQLIYIGGKWSETFVFLNSSFNPMIYIMRIRDFRAEILKFLRVAKAKLLRRPNDDIPI
eukprot:Seg6745.2 transcript_id=Seg6745.2/GoldUCD/mRNA.D3Y31 product="Dopamine receptor 1" protein_id=Seg6745.2/GoldUCD/D3Y31